MEVRLYELTSWEVYLLGDKLHVYRSEMISIKYWHPQKSTIHHIDPAIVGARLSKSNM